MKDSVNFKSTPVAPDKDVNYLINSEKIVINSQSMLKTETEAVKKPAIN